MLKKLGRPSIPPGVYFRMLMVGYLEGLDSERGIAWRCSDSMSLRAFLGYGLEKNPPEHSGLSTTRKRLSVEAHEAVFGRVLEMVQASGLLSGKTLGIDSTTLEANAAMRSMVRRDDSACYEECLRQMARASGIETPTREDLAKLDRKRPKKGSNKDWVHDPEARITRMKDGTTHLAHKLEQAVDLETGAVVAVTVQTMRGGDVASLPNTLREAERQLAEVDVEPREVVADKGYHPAMTELNDRGVRSYVSEPKRGRRNWKRNRDAQKPTYANRRRIRGNRLLRQRGEKVERAFAHLLLTGGMRRVHVRGQESIRKRMLIHAAALNLGLIMRKRFGFGTPRGLQGLRGGARGTRWPRQHHHFACFPPLSRQMGLSRAKNPLLTPSKRRLTQHRPTLSLLSLRPGYLLKSLFFHGLLVPRGPHARSNNHV